MTTRVENAGIYGFVNGLGYRGDPATRRRLVQSAQRAANRGDWGDVLGMGAAYLIGSALGASLRGKR